MNQEQATKLMIAKKLLSLPKPVALEIMPRLLVALTRSLNEDPIAFLEKCSDALLESLGELGMSTEALEATFDKLPDTTFPERVEGQLGSPAIMAYTQAAVIGLCLQLDTLDLLFAWTLWWNMRATPEDRELVKAATLKRVEGEEEVE
jgi:hypothetical protein